MKTMKTTNHKTKIASTVIEKMDSMGHEQIMFCNDSATGLQAIIAIHDTNLGPALGGVRMWNYDTQEDALEDVLRLSRGMTFKAAISGLKLGGGKAVIIGDPYTQKNEFLIRRFGKFVDSLGGKYITAEDVGMTTRDIEYLRLETKHVTGIPEKMGGSGSPSPITAFGVYQGMKASAKFKWGSEDLKQKKVLVQGVGHVGENIVKYLTEEGAIVVIDEINKNRADHVAIKYGVEIASSDCVYDLDVDIYSPCALGGTLNSDNIKKLKCEIIAGAANNQLEDEDRDAILIQDRNILYAPDFLINAGGLISVYSEIQGYKKEETISKTQEIFNTTLEIFSKSEIDRITPHEAALKMAQERIQQNIS